jgi:hypothetical protein
MILRLVVFSHLFKMMTRQSFIFISKISKVSYCIDIKRIFSHTNNILFVLNCISMDYLIILL